MCCGSNKVSISKLIAHFLMCCGGVGHACESNDDQEMLVLIPAPFLFPFSFLCDLGKDLGCDFINAFVKRIKRW